MTDTLRQAITDTAQAIASANKWRSMLTAPKDGTLIDVWVRFEHRQFRLADVYWGRFSWGAEPVGEFCWLHRNQPLHDHYGLVAWLPLPAPPAREGI